MLKAKYNHLICFAFGFMIIAASACYDHVESSHKLKYQSACEMNPILHIRKFHLKKKIIKPRKTPCTRLS